MSRRLRIEFPSPSTTPPRGDRRVPIYRVDEDRLDQLDVIAQAIDRFEPQALAYCQMGNHFHLVLYTRQGTLSRPQPAVRGLTAPYVGPVFQDQ
jgi:hypothetical protein